MCEVDYSNSYTLLNDYANVLLMTNNDANVKISRELVGNEYKFKRIFISFRAQQQGFMSGCRRLVGLDGCHLKTSFGGILVSAVALDANNGVFPLAVSICEVESKESWIWFLKLFKEHMDIQNNMTITFMSDRQKGIIYALKDVFPDSEIRYCAQHVYANFRKQYSAEILREYFWKATKATNKTDFDNAMAELNKIDGKAYNWLIDNEPHIWSCHHFDSFYKSDHVTNNMTESWNGYLNDYRRKPILELLEFIRMKLMKRMIRRRKKCKNWGSDIPPRVQKRISKIAKDAGHMSATKASEHQFEVVEFMHGMERHYVVDLNNWYCECGGWQMSGIPCKHAMAGILLNHAKTSNYVHKSLTKEAYLLTYSATINPLPDRINWPKVDLPVLKPPVKHVQPGRPKLNRRKEVNEARRKPFHKRRFTVTCSKCREVGHNKKKCPTYKAPQTQLDGVNKTQPSASKPDGSSG